MKKYLPIILFFAGFVFIIFLLVINRDYAFCLIEDGQPVENIALLILFLGAGISIKRFLSSRGGRIFWGECAFIFLIMAIRELDIHRRIRGYDFLRGDFYTNENISFFLRLFFAVILLAIAVIIIHFVLRNILPFIASLRKKQLWTFTALGFLSLKS